jgi:predicted nucleic acid-binding protein
MALVKVELGAEILISARGLIQRHSLRAFDAIHLASALGLQAAANEPVTFVAADQRLLRAAAGERLATVNPETASGR